jgi:hypothetical protein
MSAWNVNDGYWTGGSFSDSNSFYYKLNTFLTTPVASGGAGWYLIDDLSSDSAAPWYSFLPAAVSTVNDTITINTHGFHTGQTVSFLTSGGGIAATPPIPSGGPLSYAVVVDANTIRVAITYLNAINGTYVDITGIGSGTHYVYGWPKRCYCNVPSPTLNEVHKFLWIERGNANNSGGGGVGNFNYCFFRFPLWWNVSTHRAYGIYSGCLYQVVINDSAWHSYSFRGNTDSLFIASTSVYPLPGTGIGWYSVRTGDWEASTDFVEDLSKTGTLISGATAGNNVVLSLGSGQAANFTIGNRYFLYDFGDHTWLNYPQITARDLGADTITVDTIFRNFPSGSVIAAYPHRFQVTTGNVVTYQYSGDDNWTETSNLTQIPYMSSPVEAYNMHPQSGLIYTQAALDCKSIILTATTSVGANTYYYCQRPILVEYVNAAGSSSVDMNRVYGTLQDVYLTNSTGISSYVDKRTIGGIDYKALVYSSLNNPTLLVRDSTSAV